MSSMISRIEGLLDEASAAIAGAADAAGLEQLRVEYLGRKSDLTQILRGIAELPADERGPVGGAANAARAALEAELEARRGSSRPPSSSARSTPERSTSPCRVRRPRGPPRRTC